MNIHLIPVGNNAIPASDAQPAVKPAQAQKPGTLSTQITLQHAGQLNTQGSASTLPEPELDGTSVTQTLGALNSLSPNLPIDISAAMALFQEKTQELRDAARSARSSEMQAQISSLQEAAQKIRDAATDRLKGAIVSGTMQIIGGASFNQVTGGIGSIAQAAMEHKAAQHDARKAELEADARVHEEARNQANDLMQQMNEIIRDVRDKLSEISRSSLETQRGIARNI